MADTYYVPEVCNINPKKLRIAVTSESGQS